MIASPHQSPTRPALRRVLTFWPLLFYGLSVIVGAGIYVAIGSVIARSGDAAPLSFAIAGVAAALTGLCYAELASRFPEASGAVAYVKHGFDSDVLCWLVGATLAGAVMVSGASIASGAVHYLSVFVKLPSVVLTVALIGTFTAIAALGVRESVGFAAAMGVVEIAGVIIATVAGLVAAPDIHLTGLMPLDWTGWRDVAAGAFIAFFAFIGFETLSNMAEEVKDARRIVPRGILGAVAASTVLYVAVAFAVVMAHGGGATPLVHMLDGTGASIFALFGSLAIANGIQVEIIMLARLFYGMAHRGQLPAVLARLDARTHTPVLATMLAGLLVLVAALTLPFDRLLVIANMLTLGVFAAVDLALWRIQLRHPAAPGTFAAPRWVPPLAAAIVVTLIVMELIV